MDERVPAGLSHRESYKKHTTHMANVQASRRLSTMHSSFDKDISKTLRNQNNEILQMRRKLTSIKEKTTHTISNKEEDGKAAARAVISAKAATSAKAVASAKAKIISAEEAAELDKKTPFAQKTALLEEAVLHFKLAAVLNDSSLLPSESQWNAMLHPDIQSHDEAEGQMAAKQTGAVSRRHTDAVSRRHTDAMGHKQTDAMGRKQTDSASRMSPHVSSTRIRHDPGGRQSHRADDKAASEGKPPVPHSPTRRTTQKTNETAIDVKLGNQQTRKGTMGAETSKTRQSAGGSVKKPSAFAWQQSSPSTNANGKITTGSCAKLPKLGTDLKSKNLITSPLSGEDEQDSSHTVAEIPVTPGSMSTRDVTPRKYTIESKHQYQSPGTSDHQQPIQGNLQSPSVSRRRLPNQWQPPCDSQQSSLGGRQQSFSGHRQSSFEHKSSGRRRSSDGRSSSRRHSTEGTPSRRRSSDGQRSGRSGIPEEAGGSKLDNEVMAHYLESLIKTLHENDPLYADPVKAMSTAVPDAAVRRGQRRRIMALEDILRSLPVFQGKYVPLITPAQVLACSYLRLSTNNVEDCEQTIRDEGVDPGVHVHMTVEQVEQYFLTQDRLKQLKKLFEAADHASEVYSDDDGTND